MGLAIITSCVGVARTSLRDAARTASSGHRAARSLLLRRSTTKLSDHRRHRWDSLSPSNTLTSNYFYLSFGQKRIFASIGGKA
ncbi:MAG: hypothetical protein ACYTXA_25320 [Nostoc sp.]